MTNTQKITAYDVNVCRIGYATRAIPVLANSEVEAGEKALDIAGNFEFYEKSSDYELVDSPVQTQRNAQNNINIYFELMCNDDISMPAKAVHFNLPQKTIDKIEKISKFIKDENLTSTKLGLTPFLLPENRNDSRLDDNQLLIGDTWISFEGIPKHSNSIVYTPTIEIKDIIQALNSNVDHIYVSNDDCLEFIDSLDHPINQDVNGKTILFECGEKMSTEEFCKKIRDRSDYDH